MAEAQHFKITTSHGTLAVTSAGVGAPALLLLHSNSFCSKIWRHVFSSPITQSHRVIAFDLPGHGDSSNAPDPEKSYTMPAYAAAAVELLHHLRIPDVVVLGWSLGGHVGIEMIPRFPGLKGLMIVGAPPVAYGEIDAGFTFGPAGWRSAFPARDDFSEDDVTQYAHVCADPPYEDWMREAVARTDPRARKIMFEGFASGEVLDQRKVVGESDVSVAVVNGADEPFVNLEFVRGVKYKNLWRGECFEMEGLKHAPFWARPEEFGSILEDFVSEVSR
jgi:pimeloyl-ACP methyl ester carboxylesterase